MKRFEFPLDRVRRWRREQASIEELKLQQLRAELAGIAAGQREIERARAASEHEVLDQPFLDAAALQSLEAFRRYSREQLRGLINRQQQCQARIAEQRAVVLEARRKFELLDRLHQQSFEEWKAAVNKEQEDLAAELFLAARRRAC